MAEPEDPFESTRMTLGEHLEELRHRLFIGVGTIFVLLIATWFIRDYATTIVLRPYFVMTEMLVEHYTAEAEEKLAEDPTLDRGEFFVEIAPGEERLRFFQDTRMQAVAPGEPFFFMLKICLFFSLFVGAPVLLWQVWKFVAAGLYERERKSILRYFPASVALFVVGVVFGYFLLVPYGMYFLNRTAPIELIRPDFRVQEYFSFLSSLCLALGLVFQLPILMMFLARLDIVPPAAMAKYRGTMLVTAVIIAAFLTPPDPYTQLMMAGPIVALYEIGIWCAKLAAPKPVL